MAEVGMLRTLQVFLQARYFNQDKAKMSEDNLTIEFATKKLRHTDYRAELEKIYKMHIPMAEGDEYSIEYTGNKAKFFRAFFSPDLGKLDHLLRDLEEKGVSNLVARAWYDNSGEETYFVRIYGKLLEFSSTEEIDEYLDEINKGDLNVKINYGKKTKKHTMLIRLHVKAKSKREKLLALFSSARNCPESSNFVEAFKSFIKCDSHDIEWCRFKWKKDEKWNEVCSEDLSAAFTDVQEIDEYILLAFDLDKISTDSNIDVDSFIWVVFSELDGVRKVWVKYRPKKYMEQYLYFPGMGDESYFVGRDIKNDNDWPKL